MDYTQELARLFADCFNVMRSREGITGMKALRNFTLLLNLRLIGETLQFPTGTSKYVSFMALVRAVDHTSPDYVVTAEQTVPEILADIWENVLSEHPVTSQIYAKGRVFDLRDNDTLLMLVLRIGRFDFSNCTCDVLGEAYESVVKGLMVGKTLGQFFTPCVVKDIVLELVAPQIHADGTCETIYDPAMGTAGFLLSAIHQYANQATSRGVVLDMDYVCQFGVGGREIEPSTCELAMSNVLIATGRVGGNMVRGDSITNITSTKYDIVVANPPFGLTGIRHAEITDPARDNCYPIATGNSVALFIQLIIHVLKIGGRCGVVLPHGENMRQKRTALEKVREYLLRACDLHEVIILPPGIFEYTNIETCILYFTKRVDGACTCTVSTKTGRKPARSLHFHDEYATTHVRFSRWSPAGKTELADIPIASITERNHSLAYTDYLANETPTTYEPGVRVCMLGEICERVCGVVRPSRLGYTDASKYKYPLYYCSVRGNLWLDTYDYHGTAIIINKVNGSGRAVVYLATDKYSVGESVLHFRSKSGDVSTMYIWCWLSNHTDLVMSLFVGVGQKTLNAENFYKITIPIPPPEEQLTIIQFCERRTAEIHELHTRVLASKHDIEVAHGNIKSYFPH